MDSVVAELTDPVNWSYPSGKEQRQLSWVHTIRVNSPILRGGSTSSKYPSSPVAVSRGAGPLRGTASEG